MHYTVELRSVPATPLLAVRRRATLRELSQVVPDACGVVWKFIRDAQIASTGHNVAVYLSDRFDLEVGVEVGAGITPPADDDLSLSATPSGMVATTAHFGPYAGLVEAHEAIQHWCRVHEHRLAGPRWEVYGHWTDDPDQLRTDVYYLLEAPRTSSSP